MIGFTLTLSQYNIDMFVTYSVKGIPLCVSTDSHFQEAEFAPSATSDRYIFQTLYLRMFLEFF